MTTSVLSTAVDRIVRDPVFLAVYVSVWLGILVMGVWAWSAAAALPRLQRRLFPRSPDRRSSAALVVFKWLLVGLLIRLSVMPFTMHPDLIFLEYFPSLLAYHGVVDVYGYLKAHHLQSIQAEGWFYYPPLTYFTIGAGQWVCRPLMPLFEPWITALGGIMTTTTSAVEPYLQDVDTPHLMRHLFLLKLPYLAFDMVAAALVLRVRMDDRARLWAFKAWMLNPVTLYSCFMAGRFEIIPACLLLASVVMAEAARRTASGVWLGLATACNTIPGLCLPALCLGAARTVRERVRVVVAAAIPYALLFVPLYVSSQGFVVNSVVPPLRRSSMATAGTWLPAVPAIGFLLLVGVAAYGAWLGWLQHRASPAWLRGILAAVLIAYVAYAWRLHLGVVAFLVLFGAVVALGAAAGDMRVAIDIAVPVALFDVAARYGLGWATFLFVYGLMAVHAWRRRASGGADVGTYYLIVLTTAFTLTTISFYWFVVVTPFLAVWLASRPAMRIVCAVQIAALALTTLYYKTMLGQIWSPLHPAFFATLPDLTTVAASDLPALLRNAQWVFRLASWAIVGAALSGLFRAPAQASATAARAWAPAG